VLLVVQAELVGALEPGDDFLNAVDVHEIRNGGLAKTGWDRGCRAILQVRQLDCPSAPLGPASPR